MNIPIAVQVIDVETPPSTPPQQIEATASQQDYLEQIYVLEEDAQKLKTIIAFLVVMLVVAIIMVVINTHNCVK